MTLIMLPVITFIDENETKRNDFQKIRYLKNTGMITGLCRSRQAEKTLILHYVISF